MLLLSWQIVSLYMHTTGTIANVSDSGAIHERYHVRMFKLRERSSQRNLLAATHIMNDDLESAEAGLNEGDSSYHKVSEHWHTAPRCQG